MAITYGYFNSIDGDRKYNADQMSEYFDGLVSDGVYESVGGALQVLAGTGMQVQVQTGRMIINSKWLKNDAVVNLNITQAHPTLNRYTAVVAKLDITNRLMTITTKDGTEASDPVKPTMQNDDTAVEKCLAYVYVGKGATAISQSNITDTRPDNSVCGWVTGLVDQVDTSQLFLQWQTAYEEFYYSFQSWFETLTRELQVNTYLTKYTKRFEVTSSSGNVVQLDMLGYTYESDDIINVYINGLYASEGVDYTLNTSGSVPTVTPTADAVGTVIDIMVIKSTIGNPSGGGGSSVSELTINNVVTGTTSDEAEGEITT